jgi:hypothetical protein
MTAYPFPGVGIVFDIGKIDDAYYGLRAWRSFVRTVPSHALRNCLLVEGDTTATLNGRANEFCIGVYGPHDAVDQVRAAFTASQDPILASAHRRFIEKIALDAQPLPIKGHVDSFGRLITREWNTSDQGLCEEAGWGYLPESVPALLDDAARDRLAELARLVPPQGGLDA